MVIPLTEKQYRDLLLVAYLGEWVVNAGREGKPLKGSREILDYLCSFAKSFGETEWVEPAPVEGRYMTTEALEDEASAFIDEYEDDSFWEHLVQKLAERDFEERHPDLSRDDPMGKEAWDRRVTYIEKWAEEVKEHGLERFVVRELLP